MLAKYFVIIATCFVLTCTQVIGQQLQVVNGKIKINIGTASGCGDTVNFIQKQLAETYRLYGDYLNIEFVPWGRTVINNNGVFRCQFGEADCWANRLHRCVLNMLKEDQQAQVQYMICEFAHPFPSFLQQSYQCVEAAGVNLTDVDHCVGIRGDDLDKEAQAATLAPVTEINFIPYIVFNDVIDVSIQSEARTGLKSMICLALAEDPSTGVTDCGQEELEEANEKMKMTIGTASGCRDTVNFIQNQLAETYRLYGDYLNIEFVPWGRTVINNNGVFQCQFGEADCWANRLHRCVLNMLKEDQQAQVRYMICEFAHPFPSFLQQSYQCVEAAGVNLTDVDHCVGIRGDDLDKEAQAAALAPVTEINFIPYIVFNDVIDVSIQSEARTGLKSMICLALAEDPSTGVTDCGQEELEEANEKMKMTIGTASGCRDTVNFIQNQLAETYRLYGDYLNIEFVPWGRTVINNNGVFQCQFGEADCWANRLHRCVLNMLKEDQQAQVRYMICEFAHPFPSFLQQSYQCVEAAGVNLTDVDHCVGIRGDDLDKEAQAAALAPVTEINFIPYIVFNDVIDVSIQSEARTGLKSMICLALAEDPSTGVTDCGQEELEEANEKMKMTIGTASGCRDTVNFIQNQLAETYRLYGDYLNIEFVPWGRTVINNNGVFQCQFGEADCWANRLHRCVLNMLKEDQQAQVRYMICEFAHPFPSFLQQSYQCVEAAGVNLTDVDHCVGIRGDDLDKEAQAAALAPVTEINFIPYIVFNDVIDVSIQSEARTGLKSMICLALAEDPSTGVTDCGQEELEEANEKMKMTIGTASGCRDTVNFIQNQLAETYRLYGDYLNIEFVPWGRTVINNNGVFQCQFGEADCWANRLHRCVLNMLKEDQQAQVRYMICEFAHPFPSFLQQSYQCVEAAGVNLTDVDHCVGIRGDDLDKEAQAAALAPVTEINFIPYIVFNDVIDVSIQSEARTGLKSMICLALAEDPSTGVTDCGQEELEEANEKMKMTIGTASGCRDTVNFIQNQLAETYRLYGDYLNIEFVPWGRTVINNNGVFQCQFGEADCWANRLHRCVLNMLKEDQQAQVQYMICEFAHPFPSFLQQSYQCVEAAGVNLTDVDHCVGIRGDDLDKEAQAAALAPVTEINFIPYIVFNDVIDVSIQSEARTGLKSMICLALAEDPSTGVTDCGQEELEEANEKMKMTIGTASGCRDTVNFIQNQLAETYRLYGDYLNIEFVPWGRTVINNNGVFQCQFGEADCWANRLHRCVLNMLKEDQQAQVQYMICEFAHPFPSFLQQSYQCVEAAGVNLTNVDHCVGIRGDDLDKEAQAAALAPVTEINFIPYIVFNDVIDVSIQSEARTGLKSMICLALAEDPSTGVTDCGQEELEEANEKMKMTIGTASGCRDTVNFIQNQLAETYRLYGDYLNIEFVPWGRTVINNNGVFQCQFGEADCWANRLHRCVLNMLKEDQQAQVRYMICEFAHPFPSFLQQSYQCVEAAGVNLTDVDHCVGIRGDDLDKEAQAAALAPVTEINFIPYIVFNDVIDVSIQSEARTGLKSMICLALAEDPSTGVTDCGQEELEEANEKMKMTIGTASGCRDTVNFIQNQLAETYRLYGDYLNIEFVPWGRTVINNNGVFQCQFGEADCWANRLHRCVLNMLKEDQQAQVRYMICEFAHPFPSFLQQSYQCVEAAGVNLTDVDHCVGIRGDDLDKEAQAAALAPVTEINFIPYIIFNDVIDVSIQSEARTGLKSMICLALAEDPSTGVTDCGQEELEEANEKMKMTIGTASGCRDTVNFIQNQLAETYRLYGDYLNIEFVPWGRTVINNNGVFQCQFGEADCWANRLHRCVLNMLKEDQQAQVQYMICEFAHPFPSFLQQSYQCVEAAGVNLTDVDHCVGIRGDDLDKEAQAAALAPVTEINFIPYIVFNDVIDVSIQSEARTGLKSMICLALAEDPSTGVTDCGQEELEEANEKMKMTIGTASGCRDTVNFIQNQLAETYRLYGDYLNIEFVPWGRTVINNNGVFRCQFGEADCWANRLHRCVLNMLKEDQQAQVQYMICEFAHPFPSFLQQSYQCVEAAGVNLTDVDHCVGIRGDDLDKEAQAAALAPVTEINFIPYIVFNDVIDVSIQSEARIGLKSMICLALTEDLGTGVTNC